MASNAAVGSDKSQPEQKSTVDETVVAPEVSRFPKDIDGASHGPVWQSIAVPLKADPANNPDSDEWNQAKQAFKETGLLNRMSDHVADP
ncbi:hypothetical protein KC19_8G155700 [Ceratodon purpureus]|uniref:Uncharacterized protein n=1 Tax=Ceratodon purpureus TaxID=3225 RepID=A0A8T0GZC4_CERPU|nr:hypothetical protein KC19_8G155700 [Ceratodon purpureus]